MSKWLTLLLLSSTAYAAIESVKIQGVVVSFDEKHVVLKQKDAKLRVPRKYFADRLRSGETVATIPLAPEDLNEVH